MGIDIGCCLIVGVPGDDLDNEDILGEKGLYDYVDDNDLDYSSPWYDAGCREGIVGIKVITTGNYTSIDVQHLMFAIEHARKQFKELTGMEPSLYLSNNVY